jgi:tRNA(Ile)-lysidine synthase
VLPDIERLVAPGARRALVRLAALASEDEAGWASVLATLLGPVEVDEAGGVSVDRAALAVLHPAVRARILRTLVARSGARLDERGTRLASEFVASSGRGFALDVGQGLLVRRELDRVWIGRSGRSAEDRPLMIRDARPGSGSAVVGGRTVTVAWGGAEVVGSLGVAVFDRSALRFPLSVRAREPGDRIRLAAGTKKVKKLLLEARIPRSDRERTPLVVDAEGDVLWVPGVARATSAPVDAREVEDSLRIGIG